MMFNEVINTLNQERNVAFVPVSDCVYEGLVKIHEEDLRLQIDLGQGFPTKFPIISIPEDQHFRAHVQVGEKICLFNEESILIKPDMACQMLLDAYDRAVFILSMDSKTQREEILREFISYWGVGAKNNYRLYMNLPVATDHEYKEYTAIGPDTSSLLVSGSVEESKGLLINNFSCDTKIVDKRKMPCIRIRLRETTLPQMIGEPTWKSIRHFILANITARQKRLFNQMLSLRQRTINRILLLAIPSAYGDQYACIWLHHNNPRGESLRNITNCHVEPIIAFRIDRHYMLERCGSETNCLNKRVLLIGCGSVGGFLAENLCQCGIGALDILDRERISIDNVHRHVLGFNDAVTGKYKADLLKARLEERFPYVDIDSLTLKNRTAEALLEEAERLTGYDLVISATGNPTVNLAINDVLRRLDTHPPFIVCFNEPYGIGGHAIAVLENGGCLRCLYTDPISGELTSFQGSFVENGQNFNKSLSGCLGTFVEYSALDSQQTAILASRLIFDVLKGKCLQSKITSWVGAPDKLREFSYKASEHYEDLERSGLTAFDRDFPRSERCKICGK